MDDKEESAWEAGRRTAYERLLNETLSELGYSDHAASASILAASEVQARTLWRMLFDDPYPKGLHLADVLEKIGDEVGELTEGGR